jgi:hypothetical protein
LVCLLEASILADAAPFMAAHPCVRDGIMAQWRGYPEHDQGRRI